MVVYGTSLGAELHNPERVELEHYNVQASFMPTYTFKPKLIAGEIK